MLAPRHWWVAEVEGKGAVKEDSRIRPTGLMKLGVQERLLAWSRPDRTLTVGSARVPREGSSGQEARPGRSVGVRTTAKQELGRLPVLPCQGLPSRLSR